REARLEREREHVGLAGGLGGVHGEEPQAHGGGAHGARVEATAVVLHLYLDGAADLARGEEQRALLGLAGAYALDRRLEAMIDGVAQQMNEHAVEDVEDLLVDGD